MKHLVDVDEDLLSDARDALGTSTIKETVNEALRRAAKQRQQDLNSAVDELADLVTTMPIADRSAAW
jgi:Arc/MetJ family transcription regulator